MHGVLTSLLDQDLVATGVLSVSYLDDVRGDISEPRDDRCVPGPGSPMHEMFGGSHCLAASMHR